MKKKYFFKEGKKETLKVRVPIWPDNHELTTVYRGQELLAYNYRGGSWYVKEGRCKKCGKCCPDDCKYLRKEVGDNDRRICVNEWKPFRCCFGPLHTDHIEGCSITFREVKE